MVLAFRFAVGGGFGVVGFGASVIIGISVDVSVVVSNRNGVTVT